MIARYSTPEMTVIWSDEAKFRNWIRVETECLRAKVKLMLVRNVGVPDDLESRISIDVNEIDRIEAEVTGHDVMAFLHHTTPQLPAELQPHWHDGMTSYDTQDTALSLQLATSVAQLSKRLKGLMQALESKAQTYKLTPMMGRTHGVHAEPITFGVKLANWYDELKRQQDRLRRLSREVAVGKISGAVGMYTLPPLVEQEVCSRLGLDPIVTTQIISRDIHAEYLSALATLGGTLSKIGIAARLMQQTEVRETQEFFRKKQEGSSAMPHKRNPIGFENITGLSRVLRAFALVGFENQETWHERDITNSGAERIVLPDASQLADYMIRRLTGLVEKWVILPDRMMRNLEITKGLIFSQEVTSLVAAKTGLPRPEAYDHVKEVAQVCFDSGEDFVGALLARPVIAENVTRHELVQCLELEAKLRNVDYIYSMIFN